MVADPFGGQVLRDLVPQGHKITSALPEMTARAAIARAVRDSGGTPAFLAVEAAGVPTLLVVRRLDDGRFGLLRPGDFRPVVRELSHDSMLGEIVAALGEAHDPPSE